MATNFDISKVPADTLKGPATWSQIRALSYRLMGTKEGKPNYEFAKQIQGCLYHLSKNDKFSFKQANKMFNNKKLPVVYRNAIRDYSAQAD